ncbi:MULTISPECIES: SLC13 family permease [unclassified Pseudodesulfovibrio]|uniref:SLC13 family permease n=1 Tax=unclassified Pseudodesulfovibrio TaxID=2661612 RepID=UPI000FEC0598|nr:MULTISPECIES: SLC13 family permease [unclassified Pseudodesulfovibrio]MCJ2163512.1 SLC13 family permease [Pseudodesulfovibrio sp. S3-i]RWU06748.1 SLC13 family permease [Pseudodesulfovibrio sp. S3]
MTPEIIMVMAVLGFAVLLFIFEWVRVDVVGIIMMVLLPLLGLVTPKQAISGLSSNAVVSIIAVIIIGAGLDKTGVMNSMARVILRFAGKSETRIMTLIAGTVAVISGFMQNIGAAALFLPAAKRIGNQTGVPIGRLLMPMGFCAIIGGCLTLVGSSPLILLNDLMVVGGKHYDTFGLFSVTPVGLLLIAAALGYFIFFGRFILPSKGVDEIAGPMSSALAGTYQGIGSLHELHVPQSWSNDTEIMALELRPLYFSTIVAIAREDGTQVFAPDATENIQAGDHLVLFGPREMVEHMAENLGWELQPELASFAEELSPNNAGVMEGLVTPRSELVGETLADIRLRERFKVSPLAIFRGDKLFVSGLYSFKIESGDAILLHGRWEMFHMLKEGHELVFTEDVKGEILRTEKAKIALMWLAVSLVMILGFHVQLSIALLAGALGMILTKVLTIDEAYQSVDWMTVFLLGGLIPLGMAFENTGAAKYIADTIMAALGAPTPVILLTVIGILTSFFTLVASNVGATVLLVPLSMNMAINAGVDPRIAALTVALAASNTFVLPTHQVNALIMRPGGYKTIDYVRAGAGMTVLYMVVMITALMLFY